MIVEELTNEEIEEIIDRLRKYGPYWPVRDMMLDAADALEFLLRERKTK